MCTHRRQHILCENLHGNGRPQHDQAFEEFQPNLTAIKDTQARIYPISPSLLTHPTHTHTHKNKVGNRHRKCHFADTEGCFECLQFRHLCQIKLYLTHTVYNGEISIRHHMMHTCLLSAWSTQVSFLQLKTSQTLTTKLLKSQIKRVEVKKFQLHTPSPTSIKTLEAREALENMHG